MADRWYRYVKHSDRSEYEKIGWVFASDLGPPHCFYSVLMLWPFEDPPKEPPTTHGVTFNERTCNRK